MSRDKGGDRIESELRELDLALPLNPEGDVAEEANVERMCDQAEQHAGPIPVLVNNACINLPGAIKTCTEVDFDRVMSVNMTGIFFAASTSAKAYLKTAKDPSSTSGLLVEKSSLPPLSRRLTVCRKRA